MRERTVAPKVGDGWVHFDGMTWPRAGDFAGDVLWRLKYQHGPLSMSDRHQAAAIIGAYLQMVHDTASKRQYVIRVLREAETSHPYEGRHG